MTAIRSIVVATDLSAPARRAVERAAMLAKQGAAPLALVQAVSGSALDELRRWLDAGHEVEQSIVEDARQRLHEFATAVAARHAIEVVDRTATGRSVEEIARVADERNADLIVTGTLGAGLIRHHLIGSTAERVVRKSARPVLMVRQSVHESYRRVLVPLDFSPWSAPSLDMAVAVAPGAHFLLVHCIEIPFEGRLRLAGVDDAVVERCRSAARDDAERQMAALAARAGLAREQWTAVTPTGLDPWLAVIRLEQEHDCDLVVIGKHGRNAVEELLLGSTTNRVIAEGESDVLVSARRDPP